MSIDRVVKVLKIATPSNTKGSKMTLTLTLTIQQLSQEINLAIKTIRSTLVRNPMALPPRLVIPGQKKLLWLRGDVEEFYGRQARGYGSNPAFSTAQATAEEPAAKSTEKKVGRPTKAEQVARENKGGKR